MLFITISEMLHFNVGELSVYLFNLYNDEIKSIYIEK